MTITSDDFYLIDSGTGLVMVPRPKLQAALDREFAKTPTKTKDAAPRIHRNVFTRDAAPQNNLGRNGKPAFLPGDWNRSRDESPGTSTGSEGSRTGGAPRRAERPPQAPATRSGNFTVDQPLQAGGFTNGDEELEPDPALGEKLGEFDPPPEGMVLRLVPQEDGSIAVMICEDFAEDMNQNSAMYQHNLGDAANIRWNRRLNGINRRRWSKTKDWASTVPVTLYRHKALKPGESLSLEGPDKYGGYSLRLISPSRDLTPEPLPGTGTKAKQNNQGSDWPAQNWAAAPGSQPGERSIHELQSRVTFGDRGPVMTLAKMNQLHREYWASR